jgi:hypothetical protein
MKTKASLTAILALTTILIGIDVAASAQTYTSFDALSNGTFPTEIDSTGRIVGIARQPGAMLPSQVFIRNTDGTINLIDAPASDWVGFSGGNQLVGRYADAAGVEHSFVGPIAGPFTTFDVSGSTGTYAYQGNSAGQIVGFWTNSANVLHGFLRSPAGSIAKLDVTGSVSTQPETINTSGQIAGLWTDFSGVLHGFLRSATGTYTTYNFPSGSIYASAQTNDAGQITGYYADRNFAAHAYLRDTNGTFTTLNEPGQVLAYDINQGGSIVGVFGGKYHGRKDGFLRRPDGTSATIEFPGASFIVSSTIPAGINQTGTITGKYQLTTQSNGDTVWHGFVVTGVH